MRAEEFSIMQKKALEQLKVGQSLTGKVIITGDQTMAKPTVRISICDSMAECNALQSQRRRQV